MAQVLSMDSFTKRKEQRKVDIARNIKRWQLRYLGGRVHTSMDRKHCDACIFPIQGGEAYCRDVYACHFFIKVRRSHWPRCYGPSEDEEREILRRIEEEREREAQNQRKAA